MSINALLVAQAMRAGGIWLYVKERVGRHGKLAFGKRLGCFAAR